MDVRQQLRLFPRTAAARVLAMLLFWAAAPSYAQIVNPGNYEGLRLETINQVKTTLNPLLTQYCIDSCQLINVDVEIDEDVPVTNDLGFEGVMGDRHPTSYFVNRIVTEIQVDDRVTEANRQRLQVILLNHLRGLGVTAEIIWRPVQLPSIGRTSGNENSLKQKLEAQLSQAVNKVFHTYCPDECILAQINMDGELITPDEAAGLPDNRTIRDREGRSAFRLDNVDVDVTFDAKLDEVSRERILGVLTAKTKFASPVNFVVSLVDFPEPYKSKRERMAAEARDPYGLERLRQMLTMFRDLAGTKEIIKTTSTTTARDTRNSTQISASENSVTKENNRRLDVNSTQTLGGLSTEELALYIGAGLLLVGLIIALIIRMVSANRDAKLMMASMGGMQGTQGYHPHGGNGTQQRHSADDSAHENSSSQQDKKKDIGLRMKIEELRNELVGVYVEAPRVAKETFTRMLKEEGVEETSKYIHILGDMVVFNLLDEPDAERDLYSLSEYYHNTEYDFSLDDELKLLQSLKTKTTASEIRVLSRKSLDKFNFLSKLGAEQIYNLINDENSQVQSIVLTQLDKKRRLAVFEMYQGQNRLMLMSELCKADAIPRDYLSNVANALSRKVKNRPEFDAENLRSSDILLDLLERAELSDQRKLMRNLEATNVDAARGIKMKLVTVEMLPFLKDGHLLEIILGLDREDVLAFLLGTREHVRDLLLAKAPHELAESWMEDIRYLSSVDDAMYRQVELKILSRLRNIANTGAISILDINEMIFSNQGDAELEEDQVGVDGLSSHSMVA